jgi:hypothetical protein
VKARDFSHERTKATTPTGVALVVGLDVMRSREREGRMSRRGRLTDKGEHRRDAVVVGQPVVLAGKHDPVPLVEVNPLERHSATLRVRTDTFGGSWGRPS